MRMIHLDWKVDRSGRMIRVIRKKNRVSMYKKTPRVLTPPQREKFEVLTLLSRWKKKKDQELKKKLKKAQTRFEKEIIIHEKKKDIKQFCSKCELIKRMKIANYGVTSTGLLFMQGECLTCGKVNIARVLRKATEEEKKAAGVAIKNEP